MLNFKSELGDLFCLFSKCIYYKNSIIHMVVKFINSDTVQLAISYLQR